MMRVGFASIYSWRPHVAMLHYLAGLARQGGHETCFLTCDGDLPNCYTREQKARRPAWLNCALCRAGGVRSYENRNVASIGALDGADAAPSPRFREWVHSSASTLGRFESDADFAGAEFAGFADRLEPAARRAYSAARRWIDANRLDAIVAFNGRMDATRAIFEAARDAGIRFVSQERSWFGDGVQLLPDENCLGLRAVDKMVAAWRDRPLTGGQALRAARHAAARFLRKNDKEWRAFNVEATKASWPSASAERRVLLLPGSRNETWGHPDWLDQWPERSAAFEAIIARLKLRPDEVLLRCHPIWAERVSGRSGALPERYYLDWAAKAGVRAIPSAARDSTMDLIRAADAIVVAGGSAALEAGLLGKQVIAAAPSIYQQAGFQTTAYGPADLDGLALAAALPPPLLRAERRRVRRLTLRFCFAAAYRLPQFVPFIEAATTTRYNYYLGADPFRLTRLLESGELEADDPAHAEDEKAEDSVLDRIEGEEWAELYAAADTAPRGGSLTNDRRGLYRAVDRARELLPRGDL